VIDFGRIFGPLRLREQRWIGGSFHENAPLSLFTTERFTNWNSEHEQPYYTYAGPTETHDVFYLRCLNWFGLLVYWRYWKVCHALSADHGCWLHPHRPRLNWLGRLVYRVKKETP